MDSKYYVPDLNEFHYEFEFEANYAKEGWQAEVFGIGEKAVCGIPELLHSFLEGKGLEGNVRVKYLDREDIESLGWTFFQQGNVNLFTFDKLPWRMNVSFAADSNLPIVSIYIYSGELVNRIRIKNKSELSKLLKQLQIPVK